MRGWAVGKNIMKNYNDGDETTCGCIAHKNLFTLFNSVSMMRGQKAYPRSGDIRIKWTSPEI